MNSLSIIIPVYNAAQTIERTLCSLERIPSESRSEVQVLVINDGSTDASERIIAETQQAVAGFNWVNIKQSNRGLSAARNRALDSADGDWVWFLDSDDELQLNVAAELPEISRFSSAAYAVEYYTAGRRLSRVAPRFVQPRAHLDVMSAMNPFQPSALVFRRHAITHPFDSSINVVNDWLFWIQNARLFDSMAVRSDRCIARIHIHEANMSRAYAVAGRNRAEVARRMLSANATNLTTLQRNNFYLQQQIGLMQQFHPFSLRTFFAWPCDGSLYAKMLMYALSSLLRVRASAYR